MFLLAAWQTRVVTSDPAFCSAAHPPRKTASHSKALAVGCERARGREAPKASGPRGCALLGFSRPSDDRPTLGVGETVACPAVRPRQGRSLVQPVSPGGTPPVAHPIARGPGRCPYRTDPPARDVDGVRSTCVQSEHGTRQAVEDSLQGCRHRPFPPVACISPFGRRQARTTLIQGPARLPPTRIAPPPVDWKTPCAPMRPARTLCETRKRGQPGAPSGFHTRLRTNPIGPGRWRGSMPQGTTRPAAQSIIPSRRPSGAPPDHGSRQHPQAGTGPASRATIPLLFRGLAKTAARRHDHCMHDQRPRPLQPGDLPPRQHSCTQSEAAPQLRPGQGALCPPRHPFCIMRRCATLQEAQDRRARTSRPRPSCWASVWTSSQDQRAPP